MIVEHERVLLVSDEKREKKFEKKLYFFLKKLARIKILYIFAVPFRTRNRE